MLVSSEMTIDLNHLPLGCGDTRPLVRHLRQIAFYIVALAQELLSDTVTTQDSTSDTAAVAPVPCFRIVQEGSRCSVQSAIKSMELRVSSMANLYPVASAVFDSRTKVAVESLRKSSLPCDDLSVLIDFWWTGTLAPVVVLSRDCSMIQSLLSVVGSIDEVHSLTNIDVSNYKMMRSLYDPVDTPNLRDDIRHFGKGAFVVVELLCRDIDDQLCIREMIEDTPSMTAFSSDRSAMYKEGLFFLVHVNGDYITPEIQSRASLIL
jgi:hypothetical protein